MKIRFYAAWAVVLGFSLFLPSSILADSRGENPKVLLVGEVEASYLLESEITYLLDPASELTIEDVSSPKAKNDFVPRAEPDMELYPDGGTVWFKLDIRAKDEKEARRGWLVSLMSPLVGVGELYTPDSNMPGGWHMTPLGTLNSKNPPGWETTFRVWPKADTTETIYLKVQTHWPLSTLFRLKTEVGHQASMENQTFWSGLILGVMFIITLTSLLSFYFLRERAHLWYVGFIGSAGLYFLGTKGSLFEFLLVVHPTAWPIFHLILISFMILMSCGFTRAFLQTREKSPLTDRIVVFYAGLAVLGIVFALSGSPAWMTNYTVVLGILAPVGTFLPGFIRLRQGFSPAKFYLAAWGVFSVAGFLFALPAVLKGLGAPHRFLWYNGWFIFQLGCAANAILLSLGMVDRIRRLRADRDKISRARKSVEAALVESEEKYRTIFRNAQVALFRITDEGRFLDANLTMARTLGYDDLNEMIDTYNISENWVDPTARERMYELFAKDGKVEKFEAQFYGKDRKPRWVRFSSTFFPDRGYQDGVGIGIDDEKEAQRALESSERMFQTLTDSMSAMVLLFDVDLSTLDRADCKILPQKVIYANKAVKEVTGYDPDDLLGTNALEMLSIDEESMERMKVVRDEAMRGRFRNTGVELRITCKDGSKKWIESTGAIFQTPSGTAKVIVAMDITEKKQAQEALANSEKQFRTLAENTSAQICIAVHDRFLYANTALLDYYGLSWEELSKRDPHSLIATQAHDVGHKAFEEAVTKGETSVRIEFDEIAKDGAKHWFEAHGNQVDFEGQEAWMWTVFDVSEHKRIQESIRERERQFRALADSTAAHITIGKEDRFLYANDTALQWHGMTLEEICSKAPHDVFSCAVHEEAHRAFEKAMEEGSNIFKFQFEEVGTDEKMHWFDVTTNRIRYEGEEAWLTTTYDITEHKLAQKHIEESERKFRALAESTSARIGITQGNRFIFANKALLENLELTWEVLSHTDPADTLAPGAANMGAQAYATAEETGARHFSFVYQEEDGDWTEVNASRIEIDDEEAWIWTSFDITAHKKAQEALKASEDKYRAIFNTSGTGMITFGDDKIITLANDEFAKLAGYSPTEVEGRMPWTAFFTEDALHRMIRYHERRSEDPSSVPSSYETEMVDRRGMRREGIVNINVVPGTDQRVASFLDITERKRAEAQMYQADKMASLGQIIAGVAHEINNPNNFIHFNLPILRKYIDAVLPMLEHHVEEDPNTKILNMPYAVFMEDLHKLLDNMAHGSERITGIVSELKSYIRSHENEQRKPESIKHVFDHVMTLAGKQVRKMVKTMDVYMEEDLPTVVMNAGKIEQVLINLVINAGQAADKEDSWVKLSAHKGDKGSVEIIVEDNGAGIPESILNQIFEPFYTSKSRDAGTGLGLSISQKIIQEHGGEITVASEEGVGTMFTVHLPADDGNGAEK